MDFFAIHSFTTYSCCGVLYLKTAVLPSPVIGYFEELTNRRADTLPPPFQAITLHAVYLLFVACCCNLHTTGSVIFLLTYRNEHDLGA